MELEAVWIGCGTGAALPVLLCWSASEMMWIFSYFFTDLLPNSSLRSACLEAGYPWPEVHAFYLWSVLSGLPFLFWGINDCNSQEHLCHFLTTEQLLTLLPLCVLFNSRWREITSCTIKQDGNYLANAGRIAIQQGLGSWDKAATHALCSESVPAALLLCELDNEVIKIPFVLINVATEHFVCVFCRIH